MLIEAFEYKQWADRRTLDAIRSLDGTRFPSALKFARQQLNHMVRVEELFRARLLGLSDPHSSTNSEVLPELPELAERGSDSNQWFARYARQLEPGHRLQTISFQFVDGLRGTMTRLEILFHIINHSSYHRGAISHALDMAEVPHPADTYTAFIHSAEPARREQELARDRSVPEKSMIALVSPESRVRREWLAAPETPASRGSTSRRE